MARIVLCVLFLLVSAASAAGGALRPGEQAPAFSLRDLYGRTISLDYLDGNPGVLVFWSASSPGSAGLLGDFRGYQERWGRDDLAILAVNADGAVAGAGGLKPVREFVERLDLVFPVLLDEGGVARAAYGVRELPAVVVIDAAGRISAVQNGSAPALKNEIAGSLLLAMGRGPDGAPLPAAAGGGVLVAQGPANGRPSPASCSIPRARSCTRVSERDPSAADPEVLAVRLCICHGDADAAQVMLTGVSKTGLLRLDLRFALAHLMLVKGRTAEARRAFEALRERHPHESWGEWGLGLVALAEGNAERALSHIRAARAGGWSIPEAETAVLKYLEQYWRANRPAPREEQFLALFEELGPVRDCYRTLNRRG